MSVLIVGGTGTVGSETVRTLVGRGIAPRVMSRSAEKFSNLPAQAKGVVGDLEKPASLPAAFHGSDTLFLLTPLSLTETQQGLAAVDAAKGAGIRRIVYMSVFFVPGAEVIPHFASKLPIEAAVKESGLEWAIIRPNNFFQNDLPLQQTITEFGVYPQPLGSVGSHRVDVRDIAEISANALTDASLAGATYPVNGPDKLTGEDVAAVYAHYLGRPVKYAGDDLDTWSAQMSKILPEWMVHDLRIMYGFFIEKGLLAAQADFVQQSKALHHEPRSFDSFVKEIAPKWKGSAVSHA